MSPSDKPYLDPSYQAVQESFKSEHQPPARCGENTTENKGPQPLIHRERVNLMGFNPWGQLILS